MTMKSCALVGRPNVGKSTLMNAWLDKPYAIISPKPQTTWYEVEGIVTLGSDDWLIVDTPGLHSKVHRSQNKQMNRIARSAMDSMDLIVMLCIAGQWTAMDQWVVDQLIGFDKPKILVINQIDTYQDDIADFLQRVPVDNFDDVIPISALKHYNLDVLAAGMQKISLDGTASASKEPSEKFLIQEMIREQMMRYTHHEVPYAVGIDVLSIEHTEKFLKAEVTLMTTRSGHKKVLVGENGQMIKKIGMGARLRLESLLGRKVVLKLWVSYKKNRRRGESEHD